MNSTAKAASTPATEDHPDKQETTVKSKPGTEPDTLRNSPMRHDPERMSFLLRAIIDASDDAIISQDLNGIVTSWNRAAEKMFGFKAEEIIGRTITLIIPKEIYQEESAMMGKIRAGERIEHFETRRMHRDGRQVRVSLSVSPIREESGSIIGAAKIARDTSQQKMEQAATRRLAALVASSDDAIIAKDLNGIITSWNPAAERILGYTPAEAIGQSILMIIPAELQGDEPTILGKIRAGESIEHFQTVRRHKNGTLLDVSLTVSPIREQGKVVGAAKILRDVTKQKKMEAALHTSERLASVGRLAATIAHEINNPLEAVTNFIYLARQTPDLPEHVKEYLKIADHELGRVALVAQQTLGFYRDHTKPIPVAVDKAIDDIAAIYERKLKSKDLKLKMRIAENLTVMTLQGQLKQILLNLIGNAIDASLEGGTILLSARASKQIHPGRETLVLSIADRGMGVPKANRRKIFEPFFTTKKDVGTGLGLWITRDLLERKGGHIRFRTRTGAPSGTVMTVFMPATSQDAKRESAA